MLAAASKHEFALYVDTLSQLIASLPAGSDLSIQDALLYHRINHILRIQPDEQFVLFDQSNHIHFTLHEARDKKLVAGTIISKQKNRILKPFITFFLPLLKREAFEHAVYSLVELGANCIQPITTQKIQRVWGGNKEYTRLQKIIIAAAEQSKNFAFPTLNNPVNLEDALKNNIPAKSSTFFCDVTGRPLINVMQAIKQNTSEQIVLMVGPEGDLSPQEKELLKKYTFIFCALTPTIVRAHQAAALILGFFRSIV